jgi:hypothetical protein
MNAKHRVTVNFSDAEYSGLSDLAARYQVSLAWLCRRAVAQLIEKHGSQARVHLDTLFFDQGKEKRV